MEQNDLQLLHAIYAFFPQTCLPHRCQGNGKDLKNENSKVD